MTSLASFGRSLKVSNGTYPVLFRALVGCECSIDDANPDILELGDQIHRSLQDVLDSTSFKLKQVTIEEVRCNESTVQDKVAFIVLTSTGSNGMNKEIQSLIECARSLSLWRMSRAVILDTPSKTERAKSEIDWKAGRPGVKQSKNGTIGLESSFVVDPDNCTPITYVEKLSCGDHAMLLYRNEIVSQSISISFLSSGLQRGAAGVYLASERRIDQVTSELRRRGIDTEELEKKGAFAVMSAEEWYLRRGKASADMIIGNWLKLAKDKIKEGYKGLQAVGETDCFFDNGEVKELMVYEKKLGKRFSLPVCALCVYDAARVEPKHFWSLMEAHGHGIFQGTAFKSI